MDQFAQKLLAWHEQHGRKDLPWQHDINPYRVWLSEVMLQQTQVTTVIDYFLRFTERFPTVADLAKADLDEVLHLWTGLGYYARARNLYKAAVTVATEHGGVFPDSQEALEALPGIGRSTAGAIRAIAMKQHAAILDGNVKRVLARYHAVEGYPGKTEVAKRLWRHAEEHTPESNTNVYTQAIMDLGATLCVRRNPDCQTCPVAETCQAFQTKQVERYPEPKPKKEKPVRSARFFVISQPNGATLLEQKPANGLWGGLWSPLERPSDTEVQSIAGELGIETSSEDRINYAPTFRHTFTHFHLDIEPVYISLTSTPNLVADAEHLRWVFPNLLANGNEKIGLSVPAVKLLDALQPVFTNHD